MRTLSAVVFSIEYIDLIDIDFKTLPDDFRFSYAFNVFRPQIEDAPFFY